MAGQENIVQTAIMAALGEYCRERNLHLVPPYANQQGKAMNQYCADVLGVMDGADLIALEVKELDVQRGHPPISSVC